MPGPYASKAEVVELLKKIKSDFQASDLPDTVYISAYELIDKRTDKRWTTYSGDLYVDGAGRKDIICPIIPIISISAITIINTSGDEESLDISGSDKQVWWNEQTGIIQRINDGTDDIEYGQDYEGSVFPVGLKNIKITGVFGESAVYILRLLHAMICLKMLGFFDENMRKAELLEEQIGEYRYRIAEMQYSSDKPNQRKTLDGYIEYLFKQLPQDDHIFIEGA